MTTTQNPKSTAETALDPQPAPDSPTPSVCPHCGSDHVRESSTRRGMDMMPSNIGKIPYRCRACRGRFYVKQEGPQPAPGSPEARRRQRSNRNREPLWKHPTVKRHMNEISIALGSLVAFGIFLYLLVRSGIAF